MQEWKYNELGSEFWLEKVLEENRIYVLSGRTAIDLIIQDIVKSKNKESDKLNVYMPAWCCDSMLQPFIDRNIDIRLYDVSYEDDQLVYHIDISFHVDIFYVTNYFGYSNSLEADLIRRFKSEGCIIIYDRTHSLFMQDNELTIIADYTIGSIRKWMGVICGAYISKKEGRLDLPHLREFPYLQEKKEAMRLKADYICGHKNIDKQTFLDLYANFNHHLAEDYHDYYMDDVSQHIWQFADKEIIRKKRCDNVAILQSFLQEEPQIIPMFTMVDGDCPLFVPILLESKDKRNALRRYLTAKAIYCPIHWPKPSVVNDKMMVNNIYDREISLICDQRYDLDDMRHIIEVIKLFFQ